VIGNLIERCVRENRKKDALTVGIPDDPGSPQAERPVLRIDERRRIVVPRRIDEELVVALWCRDVHGIASVGLIDLRFQLVEEPGLTVDRKPQSPTRDVDRGGLVGDIAEMA